LDNQHHDGRTTNSRKISRRKLIASLGLSGAAFASGGFMYAYGKSVPVTEDVYGKKKPVTDDADRISYQFAEGLPERTVAERLRELISVKDYGAKGDGVTNDTEAIRAAVSQANTTGGIVVFPAGTYRVSDFPNIRVTSGVHLIGCGDGASVLTASGNMTAPFIHTAGDHIRIEGLDMRNPNSINAVAFVNISGGSHVAVHRCSFEGGYTAVWLNPADHEVVQHVKLTDNIMKHFNFGVYIGSKHTFQIGGTISNVLIDRNMIIEGQQIDAGGDGIKTVKRCSYLTITNNHISGYSRDAIDLFASGDSIVVSGNVLQNNLVKGIDIKSDLANYTENEYGFNGRRLTITNNIIDGNELVGISISQNTSNGDYNYFIDVSNNQISGSKQSGITLSGRFMTVTNNMIFENCLAESSYHALLVGKNLPKALTRDINISNNIIVNNGSEKSQGQGLYISAYVEDCLVQGNIIRNDPALPNPNQKRGLYVNQLTKNITVKNNQVSGHPVIDLTIVKHADIRGESAHVMIGSLAKGDRGEFPLLSMPKSGAIVRAVLVTASPIPADSTDYIVFSLRKHSGGSAPVIFSNYSTAGAGTTAFEHIPFPDVRQSVSQGDLISVNITTAGAGQEVRNAYILLEYIET